MQSFKKVRLMMRNIDERFFSVMEVSKRLNFCYNTVWGWVKKGKLKSYCFNGGYRITERDLDDFVKKSKVKK